MAKFIKFNSTDGCEHVVNVDYIVQLHTKTHADWDGRGVKIGEHIEFYVNVANAGVACYNAEDINVSEKTYEEVWLQVIS